MGDQIYTDIAGKPINPSNKIYTDIDGKPINSAQADQRGGMPNLRDPKDVAPLAGRAVAASLPAVGGVVGSLVGGGLDPISAGAGAALGGTVSAALRNEFPQLFGKLDKDPINFAKDLATTTVANGVLPEGLGMLANKAANMTLPQLLSSKLFRGTQAVKEGVANASQQMGKQGLDEFTADLPEQPSPNTYNPLKTNHSQSPIVAQIDQANAARDLISKGYNKTSNRFQPDKILENLDEAAISPEHKEVIRGILKDVQDSPPKDSVLNYSKGRFALGLPAAALGIATGHSAITTGAAGVIYLSDKVITKLMSNPETAKLVLQAIKTPTSSPTSGILGKILANSARAALVPAEVEPE